MLSWYSLLNQIFWGIILAGCYGAYSLGSNNVANVTGVYVGSGMLSPDTASFLGGLSIVAGVLTYSKKVMMTIGKGIVPLDPFSGLVVVLAEAATLHLFTQIGVPVSSSQAVVGAVVGVGIVGDIKTVRLRMLAKIGAGWIMTPVLSDSLTTYRVDPRAGRRIGCVTYDLMKVPFESKYCTERIVIGCCGSVFLRLSVAAKSKGCSLFPL